MPSDARAYQRRLRRSRSRPSPSGSTQATSTSSTLAPAGPRRHHSIIDADPFVVSLERGLDGSVSGVADPAREAERARPVYASPPERTRPGPSRGRRPAPVSLLEAALTDEEDEAARDRAHDRGPLRAAHDQLQPLAPAPTDRHGEPAAQLELVVERLRQARARPPRPRSLRTARARAGRATRLRRGPRPARTRPRRGSAGPARRARGSVRSCAPPRPARREPRPGSRSRCRRRAPARCR